MSTDVTLNAKGAQVIARRPKPGDFVITDNGNVWLVEREHRTPGIRGVHFYAVVSTNGRYPNALNPREVTTLSAAAVESLGLVDFLAEPVQP